MSEFNLKDLEAIRNKEEVMHLLIKEGIIKEKKFIAQLEYEKHLYELERALVQLQSHIVSEGKRLVVLFEGRDAAGKGGAILRLCMHLNPKVYKVVALSKPTELEQGQWYFQRYLKHLPSKGEMVFFDRSWYNRAVVEPVFGFCSKAQYAHFMESVSSVENLLIEDNIVFLKIFLSISKEEQKKRLKERAEDPLKRWKLGPLDQQAQEKWEVYSDYIKKMIETTASEESPWCVIETDDKKKARIEVIKYVLNAFPELSFNANISINDKVTRIYK